MNESIKTKEESSSARAEAARDIAAARAEITGRRDQVIAEYEERIRQLDGIAAGLDGGELPPKVASDRLRQLLGERLGLRSTRAGRTQISMRLPASQTPAPAVRAAPTPALAAAASSKALSAIDGRLVQLITGGTACRAEARLELALLRHLRRTLDVHAATPPNDVLLLETVIEYAEDAVAVVADLESDAAPRVRRLLEFERTLVAELSALGGALAEVKEQLRRVRAAIDHSDPDLQKAMQEALAVFGRLHGELERRLPSDSRTLLDELLAS